jgi:hypothetical protein
MDWGEWGRTVLDVLDGAPAMWGVVVFLVAVGVGTLAASAARSRRTAPRRIAKPASAAPQAKT